MTKAVYDSNRDNLTEYVQHIFQAGVLSTFTKGTEDNMAFVYLEYINFAKETLTMKIFPDGKIQAFGLETYVRPEVFDQATAIVSRYGTEIHAKNSEKMLKLLKSYL